MFNFTTLSSYENKIIVKVDNKVVTSYELKNKILTTLILADEEINQENINKTKPLVLKSLIELKIKENELKKYKIQITETELKDNLKSFVREDLNNFKNKFKINNISYELFLKNFETDLAWRKLIYLIYNKKADVDNSEVELELKSILNDSKENIDYRLSELVINFVNQEEKKRKIEIINQQIKEIGFEKTSLKYNESLLKDNQGDLGWVNSKSLSKSIIDAIKYLNTGEISKPIITGNSILLLKVVNKRRLKLDDKNMDNLKKNILNRKRNQLFFLYSNSHLSKLKNLSVINYQ